MKRILGLLSACGSVYGDLFEPQIAAMFLQIFFEGVWMMCIVTFLAYELSSWRFVKIFAAAIVVGMLFIAAFVALKRNELWRVLSSKARHEWRMNERHAALRFDVLTRRSDGRHVSVSREWFKCTPCETLNDPISLFVKGCDMPGDEPPSC